MGQLGDILRHLLLDLLDAAIAAGQVAADAAVSVTGKRAKLAQANFDLAPLHVIDDLLPDSFARACAGLDPALLLGDIEEPVRRSFHAPGALLDMLVEPERDALHVPGDYSVRAQLHDLLLDLLFRIFTGA